MYELAIRFVTSLLKALLALLLVMFLYVLVAIIGSVIPVNIDDDPHEGAFTIYLSTNGEHTDLIFPLQNDVFDWTEVANPEHTLSKRSDFRFISIGWGDLEFYKKTPEWSDLQFPVAFQAVFLSQPAALHVEFLQDLRFDEPIIPVRISKSQYKKLTTFVLDSFKKDASGNARLVQDLHYKQTDAFYHAKGSLNFFYTCNTWVNQGLKESDMKACLWTPFDEGIFYQYR